MTYLWIVSFIWAFSFGLIKGNLSGLDPTFVSFSRLAISLLVFLPFLSKKRIHNLLAFNLIQIGAIQFGVMYLAYIYAFQYLQAYEVALFTIFTPLYVSLYDQISKRQLSRLPLFTALLAVGGTAVIAYTRPVAAGYLAGFLIVQASNLAFAIGQVEYRRAMRPVEGVKDRQAMAWLYLGGAAVSGIACLFWTDFSSLQIDTSQALTLLYLGVVASGLGFFLFNAGARRVESGVLAIFNNIKVPLSVAVSILIFGEQASWASLLGGAVLIILALWLQNSHPMPFYRRVG